jgi:two-component sensor histidine kinase
VVRSIARRSAESSTSVEEYAAHLHGRLDDFARTQSMVTRYPEDGIELELEVSWRVDVGADATQLIFDWHKRGGPPVMPPQRSGFGSELLERTLTFDLKGKTTLSFNGSGFQCTIVIPLNRRVVHTPAVEA